MSGIDHRLIVAIAPFAAAVTLMLTVLHVHDPVGKRENAIIVRHDNRGTVGTHGVCRQQLHHLLSRLGIQRRGRLITHHQPRVVDERARQSDPLLLSA